MNADVNLMVEVIQNENKITISVETEITKNIMSVILACVLVRATKMESCTCMKSVADYLVVTCDEIIDTLIIFNDKTNYWHIAFSL